MKRRIYSIDIEKFMYAWVILAFHYLYSPIRGGFFAVDFFLLVSSVFFFQSSEKHLRDISNGTFTPECFFVHRFSRFFPWVFGGYLFGAILWWGIIYPPSSLGNILDRLASDIGEIFMVKMNGLCSAPGSNMVNGAAWTVSSILLVEFVMYACMYHFKERFTGLVVPISLIIGMGVWRNYQVETNQSWMGITTFGTFRTWVVYCAGYYCHRLAEWLKRMDLNYRGGILLTLLGVCCHLVVLVCMVKRTTKEYQWLCSVLFIIAIAVSVSGHDLVDQFIQKRDRIAEVCVFMGEISLSIYLLHESLKELFFHLFNDPSAHMVCFICVVIVCALLQWFITPRLILVVKNITDIVKEKCLKT